MPVKSTGRRKPYKSYLRSAAADETRARIIAAARTVLAGGKDSPAFSLDAVARAAGVTRLTVYNQFESKRGLLEAIFDDTASRGGLFQLRELYGEQDAIRALRRLVGVFCRFWASHGEVFPKFSAVAKLDEEIAASLQQRAERRRQILTTLVGRLRGARDQSDLVDVLFALTSFETFEALSVRQRDAAAVETLIWNLVEDSVRRHSHRK